MRCRFRFLLLFTTCFLQAMTAFAQSEKYTSFTPKDGLPSSYVYRMLEDDKGFLWVTTNAGVARFDGKYFQVFTTKDGLPDNEVFWLVKEKDGRIWANCFNQVPAYFDEAKNRFVTPVLDSDLLAGLQTTTGTNLYSLPDGGVVYGTRDRWVLFKDGRLQKTDTLARMFPYGGFVKEYKDGSILMMLVNFYPFQKRYVMKMYHVKNGKMMDSAAHTQYLSIKHGVGSTIDLASDAENIYMGARGSDMIYVYKDIYMNPIRWKIDSVKIPEAYYTFFLSSDRLAIVAQSGKIYVYDKHTLQPLRMIRNDHYITNAYFDDSRGNEWVSSIDKGLMVYRNWSLHSLQMPEGFSNTNFISVVRKKDGTILTGNYYGEVVEIRNGKALRHKVIHMQPARIRKILIAGDDVYIISEEGIYRNFHTLIVDTKRVKSFGKTAVLCNDTTILIGTNGKMLKLNTRTGKMYSPNPSYLRVTAMAKAHDDWLYIGSTNGLYKYNCQTNSSYIPLANPLLKQRISGLCYTKDSLLWVLPSDNSVLVLKNDKIIASFRIDNKHVNSANKHIAPGKLGQVWVSTSNGIVIINYRQEAGKVVYTTQHITDKDGLAGNDIEEIFYQDGNVYVATDKGISVVPENYAVPKTDIPTYLVRMMVHSEDALIADKYRLEYGRQDVQMQFAGVDLNGSFGFLQYRLDNGQWIKSDGNILNMHIPTGKHRLEVRSVDVSGKVSGKILSLSFDVATPFWLRVWFWVTVGVVVQLLLFYFINRYQKRKREAKLAQKVASVQAAAMEQQAFVSLMSPHFIFNALNGIQYYINVQDRKNANRYLSDFASLIRRNLNAAQLSFISLEEEIENSTLYLELEKMRFNERFHYTIQEDEELDVSEWMIPTMILQPLLENAILHGIMPSDEPGKLGLRFAQQEQDLCITIIDNGIGIANSRALKAATGHKSKGMELIYKRIKALSYFGENPISLKIASAFDSISNPGTKVTLVIPFSLYGNWYKAQKG